MTRQLLHILLLFLSSNFTLFAGEFSKNNNSPEKEGQKNEIVQEKLSEDFALKLYGEAEMLKFLQPDSAISLYQYAISESIKSKDSVLWIKSLTSLSYLYAHNGNFGHAYDGYWSALSLANQVKDDLLRINIYNGLGWLYSFYERNKLAGQYFDKAISICRENKTIDPYIVVDNYYAKATLARKMDDIEKARNYLDSCVIIKESITNASEDRNDNSFIEAEYGYLLYEDGEYDKALARLKPLNKYFTTYQHSYLVIYDYFIGNIYQKKGQLKMSEKYYDSALKAGQQHKSHSDLIPIIYEELSKVKLKTGKTKEAYQFLQKAKELNEKQYGSRSVSNRKFLEIKDQFRKEQENQKKVLQEKELERLLQESKINYLRNIIFYITIFALVFLVFFIYRNLRNKYKADKQLFIEKQKMEEQKIKEVLEIKNKELTASVLQIIQHEETLAEIKKELTELKKEPDTNQINKLSKKINLNTNNNWKEFEARFVEVNENFYKELNERFPKLTQGDQKICALIKLNFDSKGMAKLLGISTESVHTTRYRLRKKLGLSRQDNLEEFISHIG
ncbi:tetratricopeptide repeat protein [Flammeovirga sp. OC4]|uniref:tetratricopeptide repeat protein n=1 Tax=Flammeovirga sp. OC4 TaxID=1382345 RepID=UPI000693487F|nr:tetratricopeptide repeat protein [Flammeovirga sp. OC4]